MMPTPCETCETRPCDNEFMDGECPIGKVSIENLPLEQAIAMATILATGDNPGSRTQED